VLRFNRLCPRVVAPVIVFLAVLVNKADVLDVVILDVVNSSPAALDRGFPLAD
jgi:hypothetical protein